MFSVLKKRLRKEVCQIMYGFSKGTVEGFFRRTLENIQHFTMNLIKKHFFNKKMLGKGALS